jgi:lysophospholipase L1-like esterase
MLKSNYFIAIAVLSIVNQCAPAQNVSPSWVETFQVSPATYSVSVPKTKDTPKESEWLTEVGPVHGTFRYRFGVSIGGSRIQVRLSNELGDKPLKIDGASIALASDEMDAVPGSIRRLTFGGKDSITLAPGAPALSDPVDLRVSSLSELITSVYVANEIALAPFGGAAMLLSEGNDVLSERFPSTHRVVSRPLLTAVLVQPEHPGRVIVALGDSITDAVRDQPAMPRGWVEVLASRLSVQESKEPLAVVSAGISGNRVLLPAMGPAALARLDRDVLFTPGLSKIILLEGLNDIGFSGKTVMGTEPDLDVAELEVGYRQIVSRAHARGIKVIGGTLTPFRGAFYFSEDKELMRKAVNAWIRTSNTFDGVIDFEAIVRDPASPDRIKAEFDSGDHLHPNQTGYKAMGEAIDLTLLK